MIRLIFVLCLSLLVSSRVDARDGFEHVRCDGNIPKALIGQHGSNEPVMAIEARHKDLKLQDRGSSDYGSFSVIHWSICDREVIVLENNRSSLVQDALLVPPHRAADPLAEGTCKLKGKAVPENIIAILRDKGGAELPAEVAWRVDEKRVRFVATSTDDLLCSRDGIPSPSPR